ncbi:MULTISPECIES: hypothetical protein [Leucobacter]|uniref:Uncharacterized protein n=1 Tax=Leucobacter manosquensis TaxID=2810611 RepID=A0ABS5M567_9MICO|nr:MULTISPECIES: hypothetical protein [Leucobacter]MBS3182339.1 hypothetical protein [Leucobacter manosquensis]
MSIPVTGMGYTEIRDDSNILKRWTQSTMGLDLSRITQQLARGTFRISAPGMTDSITVVS